MTVGKVSSFSCCRNIDSTFKILQENKDCLRNESKDKIVLVGFSDQLNDQKIEKGRKK